VSDTFGSRRFCFCFVNPPKPGCRNNLRGSDGNNLTYQYSLAVFGSHSNFILYTRFPDTRFSVGPPTPVWNDGLNSLHCGSTSPPRSTLWCVACADAWAGCGGVLRAWAGFLFHLTPFQPATPPLIERLPYANVAFDGNCGGGGSTRAHAQHRHTQ
jgi:hypothetical protein